MIVFLNMSAKFRPSPIQTAPAPDVASVTRERSFSPARRTNPVLAPDERFWRPFFERSKKIILIRGGGKV